MCNALCYREKYLVKDQAENECHSNACSGICCHMVDAVIYIGQYLVKDQTEMG